MTLDERLDGVILHAPRRASPRGSAGRVACTWSFRVLIANRAAFRDAYVAEYSRLQRRHEQARIAESIAQNPPPRLISASAADVEQDEDFGEDE